MNKFIMSRSQARKFSFNPKGTTVIISINDMIDGPAKLRNHPDVIAVCSLFFDDIVKDVEWGILISDEDAQKIKIFVDRFWNKVDNFIVHCYAGISRSSGCMSAICQAYGDNDSWIWDDPKYCPNTYVAKKVLAAFGIDKNNYDELWEKLLTERPLGDF